MCLIIAVVLGVFAFNAFSSGNLMVGIFSVAASIFFIALMVRNILLVKKEREGKK